PDLQLYLMPFSTDRLSPALHDFSGFTLSACQLRPESRGKVFIRSADPNAPPAIQANYLAEKRDLDVLLAGIKMLRRIAADPALKRLIVVERDPGSSCASDDELITFIRQKGITIY